MEIFVIYASIEHVWIFRPKSKVHIDQFRFRLCKERKAKHMKKISLEVAHFYRPHTQFNRHVFPLKLLFSSSFVTTTTAITKLANRIKIIMNSYWEYKCDRWTEKVSSANKNNVNQQERRRSWCGRVLNRPRQTGDNVTGERKKNEKGKKIRARKCVPWFNWFDAIEFVR